MLPLLCTVRGCAKKLRERDRSLVCPRGHSFDMAASGYINLLGPQDHRSSQPGDSREVALARRRFAEAGHEDWLLPEILAEVDSLAPDRKPAWLDVGCGEGFLIRSVARVRKLEAYGLDISTPAIELAAKACSAATWIVGNADRFLPFGDGTVELVTSVTSRRKGAEIRRVLSASGRAVVIVPGLDDAIELREALLGRASRRDRAAAAIKELRPALDLVSRRNVCSVVFLDAAAIGDLLATTYRGARFRERLRIDAIGARDVTLSREILVFRRR